MTAIQDNLTVIRNKIQTAAASCGRDPAGIVLVGVSKKNRWKNSDRPSMPG